MSNLRKLGKIQFTPLDVISSNLRKLIGSFRGHSISANRHWTTRQLRGAPPSCSLSSFQNFNTSGWIRTSGNYSIHTSGCDVQPPETLWAYLRSGRNTLNWATVPRGRRSLRNRSIHSTPTEWGNLQKLTLTFDFSHLRKLFIAYLRKFFTTNLRKYFNASLLTDLLSLRYDLRTWVPAFFGACKPC